MTIATLAENKTAEKTKSGTEDNGTPKKGTHEQHNIFRLILQNPDLPLEDKLCSRMSQEGNVIIGAAGETSASILKSILFYALSSGPELLSPLRDELKTVMPDSHTRPSLKELEKLPFLVIPPPMPPFFRTNIHPESRVERNLANCRGSCSQIPAGITERGPGIQRLGHPSRGTVQDEQPSRPR